jgi:DNA modification methylase
MTARVLEGDVLDVLPTLPAGSVDLVVTSPPYWNQRDYGTGTWEGGDPACDHVADGVWRMGQGNTRRPRDRDRPRDRSEDKAVPLSREVGVGTCGKCGARRVDRQLGLESDPEAYVARLVLAFRLVRNVMAPWATCFINIGDTYSVDGNLCLIPQRLALAFSADGWVVRSVICWAKPSAMPQSLSGWAWRRCRVKVRSQKPSAGGPQRYAGGSGNPTARVHSGGIHNVPEEFSTLWADCPGCPRCEPHGGYVLRRGSWRPTSSWEPILMLAKGPSYYADGEGVKTPAAAATVSRDRYTRVLDDPDEQFAVRHDHETACTAGANPRDVRRDLPSRADLLAMLAGLPEDELRDLVFPPTGEAADVQTWGPEPLREKHYAAFPTALAEFLIRAGTSARGHCPACGAPWARCHTETIRYNDNHEDEAMHSLQDRETPDLFCQGRAEVGRDPEVVSGMRQSSTSPGLAGGPCKGKGRRQGKKGTGQREGCQPEAGVSADGGRQASFEAGRPTVSKNREGKEDVAREGSPTIKDPEGETQRSDSLCPASGQTGECPGDLHESGLAGDPGATKASMPLLPPAVLGEHAPDDGSRRPAQQGRASLSGEHCGGVSGMQLEEVRQLTLSWRPTCTCPGDLPPRPPLVLDPFCGSGRTGIACQRLGCDFVGIDLSPEYVALARRLLAGLAPLFLGLLENP